LSATKPPAVAPGESLVYINGEYRPAQSAAVSVFDHGLMYGDGIFEGISIYEGRIFRLEQHLRRLRESAKTILLTIPLTTKELESSVIETVRRNRLRNGYVRVIVTRGVGKLGLDPRNCFQPTVIIIPQRPEDYPYIALGRRPARAIVSTFRRTPSFCVPASAKTLNYLNNILAKLQAINAGVDEAIMLDLRGFVSEGTGDNIFIVRHGVIATPPLHASILGGITREVVFEIARTLQIPAEERELTLHDLYNAEEGFLVSTSLEIQPLLEIDGRTVGEGVEGPLTAKIHEKFEQIKRTEGTSVLD